MMEAGFGLTAQAAPPSGPAAAFIMGLRREQQLLENLIAAGNLPAGNVGTEQISDSFGNTATVQPAVWVFQLPNRQKGVKGGQVVLVDSNKYNDASRVSRAARLFYNSSHRLATAEEIAAEKRRQEASFAHHTLTDQRNAQKKYGREGTTVLRLPDPVA